MTKDIKKGGNGKRGRKEGGKTRSQGEKGEERSLKAYCRQVIAKQERKMRSKEKTDGYKEKRIKVDQYQIIT